MQPKCDIDSRACHGKVANVAYIAAAIRAISLTITANEQYGGVTPITSSVAHAPSLTYNATSMLHASEGHGLSQATPVGYAAGDWQILWFLLHVAAVYGITRFCTPWLAGWARASMPPWQSPTSSGSIELLFSHILALSFVPAFGIGLMSARFKHRVAQFVWLVPTAILAYKILTFPGPSFFHGQFSAAFHQYFGGGFQIADFRDSHEFWTTLGPSSDMTRGMTQLNFTAPFYASVAYSVAAWITQRTNLIKKVSERVKHWEDSRFEDRI